MEGAVWRTECPAPSFTVERIHCGRVGPPSGLARCAHRRRGASRVVEAIQGSDRGRGTHRQPSAAMSSWSVTTRASPRSTDTKCLSYRRKIKVFVTGDSARL